MSQAPRALVAAQPRFSNSGTVTVFDGYVGDWDNLDIYAQNNAPSNLPADQVRTRVILTWSFADPLTGNRMQAVFRQIMGMAHCQFPGVATTTPSGLRTSIPVAAQFLTVQLQVTPGLLNSDSSVSFVMSGRAETRRPMWNQDQAGVFSQDGLLPASMGNQAGAGVPIAAGVEVNFFLLNDFAGQIQYAYNGPAGAFNIRSKDPITGALAGSLVNIQVVAGSAYSGTFVSPGYGTSVFMFNSSGAAGAGFVTLVPTGA